MEPEQSTSSAERGESGQKRQLPPSAGAMMMIDTSSGGDQAASQGDQFRKREHQSVFADDAHRYRPRDILFEESIHTLTDSEYTSADRLHGTSKRRRLEQAPKARQQFELRSTALQASLFVP